MGDVPRTSSSAGRHGDPAGTSCERAHVAAARIVAYDFPDRTPVQRAQMLRRVGITRIIWDWREEHTLRFDAEMQALADHDIDVAGLWCPMPLGDVGAPDADARLGVVDPHVRVYIDQMRERGLRPDLWTCVEFGQEGTPARLSPRMQRSRVRRVADHLEPLVRLARSADLCVALTNHLGWFGEPDNQVDVIDELASRGLRNVGIAYQFQHGHSHAARFAEVLAVMQPHLVAIALSGLDADGIQTGRKILPWGAGRLDRKLAHIVMASGWEGQVAVQGHSADDAEARLLDSLEGIEWMLDRWRGVRHQRPVPRIATPAWPEPTGIAGPYMGMSLMSRRARRRLLDTGEIAPTLARVRTSPPVPPPVSLPPARLPSLPSRRDIARDRASAASPAEPTATPLAESTTTPRRASADATRSRGGAAGALAAIQAARQEVAKLPEHERGPSVASASSAAPHPLSPMQKAPRRGRRYEPDSPEPSPDSEELPLRIAHRDVSKDAPDPYTGAIHALLTHLEAVGFTGAPRSFGWDAQGRHLVEWVAGVRADHKDAPAQALDPARIGAFMRDMHDALATFEPPADAQWFDGLPGPGGDLIIHQDVAPSNVVVTDDGRLVAIDWDAAAPGTRLWDIAHAIHAFAPLHGRGFAVHSQAERMRAFADGYALSDSDRERLLPLLALRSERMYQYLDQMRATGESPWLELWERGVGTVWEADAQWIREHEPDWRSALLG